MSEVSKTEAVNFKRMCTGMYSGHMAMIPYHPEFRGFFEAAGFVDKNDHEAPDIAFAEWLRLAADALDPPSPIGEYQC